MPKMDGLQVLANCVGTWPDLPVVMISGRVDIKTAVESTQSGAFDFIEKPPDLQHLLIMICSAINWGKLIIENHGLKNALHQQSGSSLTHIVGSSSALNSIKGLIARVGPTEARVLTFSELCMVRNSRLFGSIFLRRTND